MEEVYYSSLSSPIGQIWLASDKSGVRLLRLGMREKEFLEEMREKLRRSPRESPAFNNSVAEEIRAYFEGKTGSFLSTLNPQGSLFDQKVWSALQRIPYGETRSYQEIAREVGNPRGCRAVGGASRRNPIPLIIPCHRVIRKNGAWGGFSGGQEIKEWLLRFEKKVFHR